MQVFPETDSEDGSGWTYAVFHCPHRDDPFTDDVDLDWVIDCIGAYADPMELLYHMQTRHNVDLDAGPPVDVDLDNSTPTDVDLDGEL